MKRDKPSDTRVRTVWPWFIWRTCNNCGKQFRREHGWRAVRSYRTRLAVIYVCRSCALTAAEAAKHLDPRPPPMGRPGPVPAPPRSDGVVRVTLEATTGEHL